MAPGDPGHVYTGTAVSQAPACCAPTLQYEGDPALQAAQEEVANSHRVMGSPPEMKEESAEQPDFYYDEFGFRVYKEEGGEPGSSLLASSPLLEDAPQRLRWQAHLEFTHNHDVGDLTWDKIAVSLPRSEKLRSLVLAGIPHGMRPQLWMRLSGALQKKRNSELSYREIVKNSSNDETLAAKQIEKDLLRTMPSNACFASMGSIGVPRLRRVLRALAWLYPEIGYCQGTGMVSTAPARAVTAPGPPPGPLTRNGLPLWGSSRGGRGQGSPQGDQDSCTLFKQSGPPKGVKLRPAKESSLGKAWVPACVPPKRLLLIGLPRVGAPFLIFTKTWVEGPYPHALARWPPASCCSWRRRIPSG
ncbi:hypothetical protein H8959_007402 [Pygathrix nigripes]